MARKTPRKISKTTFFVWDNVQGNNARGAQAEVRTAWEALKFSYREMGPSVQHTKPERPPPQRHSLCSCLGGVIVLVLCRAFYVIGSEKVVRSQLEARSAQFLEWINTKHVINETLKRQDIPSDIEEKTRDLVPSRFDVPWKKRPRVKLPSLVDSHHRVLFSTVSVYGTDGIGHMMATINSEIRVAMELGLSYTHRVGYYGYLSKHDRYSVEKFFGWYRGEILRKDVLEKVCNGSTKAALVQFMADRTMGTTRKYRRPCINCKSFRGSKASKAIKGMDVRRTVHVPQFYSLKECKSSSKDTTRRKRCATAREFHKTHNTTRNALFIFGEDTCDNVPAYSLFTDTYGWFYWKYWGAHSGSGLDGRPTPDLDASKLVIAVHVRRGDFLKPMNSGRQLIPWKVFATTIARTVKVVEDHDGGFAKVIPEVYVFSEGKPADDGLMDHNVELMTRDFQDVDGKVRNSAWVKDVLLQAGLPKVEVTMRISTDTLTAMHEMIAADIFLGSLSGMSTNIVASLSRGMVILPSIGCQPTEMQACFDIDTGEVSPLRLGKIWSQYEQSFTP